MFHVRSGWIARKLETNVPRLEVPLLDFAPASGSHARNVPKNEVGEVVCDVVPVLTIIDVIGVRLD
eukprot:2609494-Pyramimonas_sp.AAC.1